MNNRDFTQHFIRALEKIGVGDYEAIRIVVEPVFEKGKWTAQTYDEIMKLQILPRKRVLSFEEAVGLSLIHIWVVAGKAEGEECFAALTERLIRESRMDDLERAIKDREYRAVLYREYGIKP